jgi:hypothetical protein
MPFRSLALASLFLACSCASTPQSPAAADTTAAELAALRAEVKTLQQEKELLDLKLQDEIERSTIQNFLRQQEVATAKRETAALRTRCGAPCAN